MRAPFQIRHATPADTLVVRTFVTAILWSYSLSIDDDVGRFGQPFNGALAELVAQVDGIAVGMACLYPRGRGIGWLSKLFVDPGYRGRGIAKALLAGIEAEARGWGLTRIGLQTLPRLREAVHLYESRGWVRDPDRREHRGSGRVYWLFIGDRAP